MAKNVDCTVLSSMNINAKLKYDAPLNCVDGKMSKCRIFSDCLRDTLSLEATYSQCYFNSLFTVNVIFLIKYFGLKKKAIFFSGNSLQEPSKRKLNGIKALIPNSDQNKFSPYDVETPLTRKVLRIKNSISYKRCSLDALPNFLCLSSNKSSGIREENLQFELRQ